MKFLVLEMKTLTTAQKLLNGFMQYRNTIGKDLAKVFENINDNPNVSEFDLTSKWLRGEFWVILF